MRIENGVHREAYCCVDCRLYGGPVAEGILEASPAESVWILAGRPYCRWKISSPGAVLLQYRMVREVLFQEDTGSYEAFGIVSEGQKISDISTDGDAVRRLADMLNRNQVSLLHFQDVVEDFVFSKDLIFVKN